MFFTAIYQMMTENVDLTLVIRKTNGQLAVSTLPKSNGLKDEAQNHIVPLTVCGLPQELDTGFLQAISRPIRKATGLITNMARFEAQAEKAASESKASKEQKAKETKEEKEKREKYEKHLKKAEELIAAKNHKDAVTALGQARLYAKPQDQKKIDEMTAEQKKAMDQGSLFAVMEESATDSQKQPQAGQRPVAQPSVASMQQVPYSQQPPRTADRQNRYSTPTRPIGQQTMWSLQQPAGRPATRQAPPQPQYIPPAAGQLPYGGYEEAPHWQEEDSIPEDCRTQYPADGEPNYNPKDYEEYPDFPQSMLEPKYSPYQTV